MPENPLPQLHDPPPLIAACNFSPHPWRTLPWKGASHSTPPTRKNITLWALWEGVVPTLQNHHRVLYISVQEVNLEDGPYWIPPWKLLHWARHVARRLR